MEDNLNMIFGILKDIKEGENRVVMTPVEVSTIVADGHKVLAQMGCGLKSGFSDEKYKKAEVKSYNSSDGYIITKEQVRKLLLQEKLI